MMTRRGLVLMAALVLAGQVHHAAGEPLRLPPLLSDRMVLQADAPVPIWGRADAGQTVIVSFGGQRRTTKAGGDGAWRVTLDPLRAGVAGSMTVESPGGDALTVRDVLVGEVWFCSGQSNMEYYAHVLSKEGRTLDDANLPRLRLFKVAKEFTPQPMDEVQGQWVASTPESARYFSAIGYLFGSQLQRDLDLPVGMIQATWGGTRVKNWTPYDALEADEAFAPMLDDELAQGMGPANRGEYTAQFNAHKQDATQPKPVDAPRWSSRIYNGMVHAVMPYRVRGVLWYQGESDAYNAALYGRTFRTMISAWRARWEQPDMPFIFVQLPGYRDASDQPQARSFWGELRQQQMDALDLPNVHMAVTTDLGDKDIHPANKLRVAPRLLSIAMAVVYQRRDVPCRFPRVSTAQFDNGQVYVKFDATAGGLKTSDGQPVRGFAVAGSDRRWHWADARIQGDAVVVRSAEVPEPVAVRYNHAEQTTGLGNLVDDAGLPAAPYRSDRW